MAMLALQRGHPGSPLGGPHTWTASTKLKTIGSGRTVGAKVVERRIQLLHERDEEHRVSDRQAPLRHALRK